MVDWQRGKEREREENRDNCNLFTFFVVFLNNKCCDKTPKKWTCEKKRDREKKRGKEMEAGKKRREW